MSTVPNLTPPAPAPNVASVQSVIDRMDSLGGNDATPTFRKLSGVMAELRARLTHRFALQRHPACEGFQSFGTADGMCRGAVNTFYGPEVDYLVDSWLGNPAGGFTNLHLNTFLGPQLRVPHLGIAMGTIPDLFFYLDFLPRVDLTVDTAYLDQYYEGINKLYLEMLDRPGFRPFVSRTVYVRQAISPCGICMNADITDENIALIQRLAHTLMDRWFEFIDQAIPVPEAERAALNARDRHLRRTVAERDPANALVVRLFGAEMTHRLVESLCGDQLPFGQATPPAETSA